MNRTINIILLTLLVLTMSCTKEPVSRSNIKFGTPVELRFETFNTIATADPEDAVNRVRIIIFGSESSSDKGQLLCNKLAFPDFNGNIAPVIITNGVRDIYLIVNEPLNDNETAKYKNIATVADIEALELDYVGGTSTPPYRPSDIPMFVRHLNRNIYAGSKNETGSEVDRMMAKVTLKLNIKDDNFIAGKYPIIKTITIKNLPTKSYYIAKPYTGALIDSESQTASAVAEVANGYNHSYMNTFYVPEYILNDIDKNAYLEIIGHANGDATKEFKWTVKVGNAMDIKQQYTRYDITRNHHYTFTGDVKNYKDDVDIELVVSPWNSVQLTSGDGEYMNVSNEARTLKFTTPEIIMVNTKDIDNVTFSARNDNVLIKKVGKELHVTVRENLANEEFVPDMDVVIVKLKSQTIEIPINYEPSMAQRFAKGMLVTDNAGGVKIGKPDEEYMNNLLFKFGIPIGMLYDGTNTLKIKYNPRGYSSVAGALLPQLTIKTDAATGRGNDYLKEFLTDPDNPGYGELPHSGDACRIMGKKTNGPNEVVEHYWRIPTADEWTALMNEGKKDRENNPVSVPKPIPNGEEKKLNNGLAHSLNGSPLGYSDAVNADFGWFMGPKAVQGIVNDKSNPVKGSIFVYNMAYGLYSPQDVKILGERLSTWNVMSSSISENSNSTRFYYATANGVAMDIGDQMHSLIFSVRCIRDYEREKVGK